MVQIRQTQEDDGWRPVFEMPIQLRIMYRDLSDIVVTVWNDQQDQTFLLDLPKPIRHILFDHDNWILKDVKRVPTLIKAEQTHTTPLQFRLHQNYPNPFNPEMSIKYSIAEEAEINPIIYNTRGEEIRTLISDETCVPGDYQISWNGKDELGNQVSTGVYLYRIQAGNFISTKKMILLR
ncbi:T9SS type A sorting domain-containing protein [candidate division KSB1 bacterium]|nr:T9SS type A sorting domain-containing protein [candidate division KSB1 bacterium]